MVTCCSVLQVVGWGPAVLDADAGPPRHLPALLPPRGISLSRLHPADRSPQETLVIEAAVHQVCQGSVPGEC